MFQLCPAKKMMTNNMKHAHSKYFSVLLSALIYLQSVGVYSAEEARSEAPMSLGRMGDSAVVNPDEFEFSQAETLIWLSDHLKNVDKPARLYYEFVKKGTFEEGFTDSVYLDIVTINEDGTKNANLDFFSQDREQGAGEDNLVNITGNPVIGIYMQGDVYEMNRIAEGHWRYFQRRIKSAISESATIKNVSIEFKGETVEAEAVTITPYVKDPRRKQFEKFADKSYEFIFSDKIPGSLYQIRTIIPDGKDSGKDALIEETLTLRNVEVSG